MQIPRSLIVLPVTLILGLTLGASTAIADPPGPPGTKASPAGQAHRAQQATDALAAVQAILDGTGSRRGATDGRSLTLALRDLYVLKDALPAADQQQAAQILARPAGDKKTCTNLICVHYTRTGPNRPSLRDHNHNGIPDYIETVRRTVNGVHLKYKHAGYRSPLPDGHRGGDKRVDIYIRNIGNQGLYGYCTSDDPNTNHDYAVFAYCVLDNNYSHAEFPTNTPIENMKVTAAHEYFHAVQFSYDAFEDGWMLESTATWAEDELFDAVNDNRNYFPQSPLSNPEVPIDTFGGLFHYGTWIFWRYLTENYPASSAGLPTLVRDVWRRLDGKTGALDEYSLQGLESVLGARGTNLTSQFANFADSTRHPFNRYEEGAQYPIYAPAVTRNLTTGAPSSSASRTLDHLSSQTVRFVPSADMTAGWQINVSVNLADSVTRPAAVVTAFRQDGTTSSQRITLDGTGGGAANDLPFDLASYKYIEVTLVNASNRTTCWVSSNSPYSCHGSPTDENLAASVTGTATPS